VFCASLADVFDNEVPQAWRDDLWALIRETPNLRWLLLTKRIGNAPKMLPPDWPYPNAGLMSTIVTQEEWDRDYPKLAAIPAAFHFVSDEPTLRRHRHRRRPAGLDHHRRRERPQPPTAEHGSRPRMRDQCARNGVTFHHKQNGGSAARTPAASSMASSTSTFRRRWHSLEMGDVALSQRMVTDEAYDFAKVAYSWLRSGRFNEKQFVAIRDAGLRLQGLPIRIEQQPKITIGQLAARARQEKRRRGLDFFVVDYLGLMESSARYKGNRTNEIGELTAGLRALAKELDCAALVLSQLSRGVEGREDKRPNMGDLRDSGNIEQDADVIIMVYREAYYLERKEPPPGSAEHVVWQDAMQKNFNKLLLIVEKQRMGPIGAVEVFCDIASNAIRDAGYVRDEFINEPEMVF
jgi:hypothetical protein